MGRKKENRLTPEGRRFFKNLLKDIKTVTVKKQGNYLRVFIENEKKAVATRNLKTGKMWGQSEYFMYFDHYFESKS